MDSLPDILPLLGAVTLASLIGSGHCVGMCGVFATFASGAMDRPSVSATLTVHGREPKFLRPATNGAYSLGRLLIYTAAGALAGLLGAALDLGGAAFGLQRAALVVAGALMVLLGLAAFFRHVGVRQPRIPLPSSVHRLAGAGHRAALSMRPVPRALVVGLLSTFLPCGWLYAFVLLAAGTGSAFAGALVMAAFWAGTVPALALVGFGAQAVVAPIRRRAPALLAVLPLVLVGVGVWTLLGRFHVPPLRLDRAPVQTTVDDVHAAASELPPCCRAASEDAP